MSHTPKQITFKTLSSIAPWPLTEIGFWQVLAEYGADPSNDTGSLHNGLFPKPTKCQWTSRMEAYAVERSEAKPFANKPRFVAPCDRSNDTTKEI
jgi:hypothetical protein